MLACNVRTIQRELKQWQEHNFPGRDPLQPTLGVNEEVAELAEFLGCPEHINNLVRLVGPMNHHVLKHKQQIRGSEDFHMTRIKDAIGDIGIFLLDLCNALDISYEDVIGVTWVEVRERNWRPDKGPVQFLAEE